MDETGHRRTRGPDSTVVAIPIYQRELTPGEASLVRSTISVSPKPVFIAPSDLPLHFYREEFPGIEIVGTDPRHFNSIRHYSEWLTTPAFYDLWSDYSWLIVCQTDAVLTADPWTRIKGEPDWDYVGAAWNPPIKVVTFGNRILVRSPAGQHRGPAWVGIVGRTLHVGNGGLSMRRIEVFRHAAQGMTAALTQETRHHIHEDVLWAAFGPRFGARIASPSVARGLFFEVARSRDLPQGDQIPDVVGLHGLTAWPLPSGQGGAP